MREFLQSFGLDQTKDIKIKYKTKATDFYRRVLEAEVSNKEFTEDLPTFDQGRALLDGRSLDADGNIVENLSADEIALYAIAPDINQSPGTGNVQLNTIVDVNQEEAKEEKVQDSGISNPYSIEEKKEAEA